MLYERRTKRLNISCELLEEILRGQTSLAGLFENLGDKTEVAQIYIDVPYNMLVVELYNPKWTVVPDGSSPEEIRGVTDE